MARPSLQLLPIEQEFPSLTNYFSETRIKKVTLEKRSIRGVGDVWICTYVSLASTKPCVKGEGGGRGEGQWERRCGGNSSWNPAKASLPTFLP